MGSETRWLCCTVGLRLVVLGLVFLYVLGEGQRELEREREGEGGRAVSIFVFGIYRSVISYLPIVHT